MCCAIGTSCTEIRCLIRHHWVIAANSELFDSFNGSPPFNQLPRTHIDFALLPTSPKSVLYGVVFIGDYMKQRTFFSKNLLTSDSVRLPALGWIMFVSASQSLLIFFFDELVKFLRSTHCGWPKSVCEYAKKMLKRSCLFEDGSAEHKFVPLNLWCVLFERTTLNAEGDVISALIISPS